MRRLLGFALLAAMATGQVPRPAIPSPEQFFGFRIGTDRKLARYDKIVAYFQKVAAGSDRIRFRNLGLTTGGNPFVMLEISSPSTIRNLERYKTLEQKLYFQAGLPTAEQRDQIFREGKAVVLITNNIHSTEIGSSQTAIELAYRLATEDSPVVRKILDNVIFLLTPSVNPDGQIMVTDWYNKYLGTPQEGTSPPFLYHVYAGHDNNRDMFLFSQKETQMMAQVLWHDWFPAIWLDQHQQGNAGARMFTMPATDPINPNVHPLIYRLKYHLRPDASGGTGGGGQGRDHAQFHLHQFLGRRDGVDRMVAQRSRPADGGCERSHRDSGGADSSRPPTGRG